MSAIEHEGVQRVHQDGDGRILRVFDLRYRRFDGLADAYHVGETAIALEIVRGVAENILFYDSDGNADTNGAYKLPLGITVSTRNSKYVYDPEKGYGNIQEEIIVQSVSENSVASRLGLAAGDKIVSIEIAGTNHPITRSFHISDVLLTVRANDALRIVYERDGEQASAQTISAFSDFSKMD